MEEVYLFLAEMFFEWRGSLTHKGVGKKKITPVFLFLRESRCVRS